MYRWVVQKRKEENRFLLRLTNTHNTAVSSKWILFSSSILFYTSKKRKKYTKSPFCAFSSLTLFSEKTFQEIAVSKWPSSEINDNQLSVALLRATILTSCNILFALAQWIISARSLLRTLPTLSWILQTQLICDSLNSQSFCEKFTCLVYFFSPNIKLHCFTAGIADNYKGFLWHLR